MAIIPTETGTQLVYPNYGSPIELDTEQLRSRPVCAMPDCPWQGEWRYGASSLFESNRHTGDHERGRVPMLDLAA